MKHSLHSSPARTARNLRRRLRYRLVRSLALVLQAGSERIGASAGHDAVAGCVDEFSPGLGKAPHEIAAGPSSDATAADLIGAGAHVGEPEASTAGLYLRCLTSFVNSSSSQVAMSTRSDVRPCSVSGRCRDIFPLPRLGAGVVALREEELMINLCIAGLNVLNCGGRSTPFNPREPTLAQRGVHEHVVERCKRMLATMADVEWPAHGSSQGVARFEPAGGTSYPRLVATSVDLPETAATCDPTSLLGADLATCLKDCQKILPSRPVGRREHRVSRVDRQEYLALTCLELRLGKLCLMGDAMGVGSLFAVGKATPGRQRCVWHGRLVSEASARPPAPRRLGNPAAPLELDVGVGNRIWSKRDATSFFDTLRCPDGMRAWFAIPAMKASELARGSGVDLDDLALFAGDASCDDGLKGDDLLWPCSVVWPMGYSWSSAVAQDVTIGLLMAPGMEEDQIMCDSHPPPLVQDEVAFVLTDDSIFAHTCPIKAVQRLRVVDEAMHAHGVQRRVDKDINAADTMIGMGCLLRGDPPSAEPSPDKLFSLLSAILELDAHGRASPAASAAMTGLASWFSLLSRPHYSIFDEVYTYNRKTPDKDQCSVPRRVVNEYCLFLAVAPLLAADLNLPYVPLITASDASSEFGFGVSVARTDARTIRSLAALSERRGDFIRFSREGDEEVEPQRTRLGKEHLLALRQCDFQDVLSIRASRVEHSSVLEARGFLLLLRWIARSRANQHHRLLALLDAKAILGAVAKGRSNARRLKPVMASISAHVLALDLRVRPLYVPSEDNPADGPSRGRRRRPPIRRLHKIRRTNFEKRDHALQRSIARLRRCGHWDDTDSSVATSSRSS